MLRFNSSCGLLIVAAMLGGCAAFTADKPAAPQAAATDATADAAAAPATQAFDINADIANAARAREQGDYADAVRLLSQLMLVDPDNPKVVSEYGKVLVLQGRPEEATSFLKRAVELAPTDWTIYSALGVAYDQAKQPANARVAYEEALRLKPGEPAVLNNYAMSRMLAGDLAGARQLIAQAGASTDPRVAKNTALIEELSHHGPVAAATTPTPPAAAPAKPALRRAPRSDVASAAPAKLTTLAKPAEAPATPAVHEANGAPRDIVMQAVPRDPLAGPVDKAAKKPAHRVPARLAKSRPEAVAKAKPATVKTNTAAANATTAAAKAAPVAAKATPAVAKAEPKPHDADGIPALRLANDRL
ncbi:MAG: tetratricopeptide repeat protein [Alphaproteobacteria bacterium]|nr:tetratricopeptide repeat protein [Alphaproteobacteria bacterium]